MFKAFKIHMQNYALHKTRAHLMGLTDRQLDDAGISRYLLNQGVDAWPWREQEGVARQPARLNSKEIDSAIRELSRMSNRELRDIGIDRGTIRHSVLHGMESNGLRRAA